MKGELRAGVASRDLLVEAFLVLAAIHPTLASVLWLHRVEQRTEEDLAEIWRRDVRTIRRWLNGFNREGTHTWGALSWLRAVVFLLSDAWACREGDEFDRAFGFAIRANPWSTPFPGAMLEVFIQARDAEVLCCFLERLRQSRDKNRYDGFILDLLERYDRKDLDSVFVELCPPGDRDPDIRAEAEGHPA